MDTKLVEKYEDRVGVEREKYVKCSEKDLKNQWQQVRKAVEFGKEAGYISQPKPGRLYGLVKDHKGVIPGNKIPPL